MKTFALISAASLLALTNMAFVSTAHAATQVELKNMAAKVVVKPENRTDVELKVVYGKVKVPTIMVHTKGNSFIADGKLKMRGLDCRDGQAVQADGLGQIANADLPTVYIKVPMNAKVSAGGATYGTIGASTRLEFNHGGCGVWTVANTGDAEVNIGGAGDVTMGNAGNAQVNIGGSGNFKAASIKALEANIGGNGDIVIDRVDGNSDINIGGSGNVAITDGVSPRLEVNIAGSGDVRFGGTAGDVDINIVGSGDVRIKKATGKVSRSVMGSGNIEIGQ
ncbi:GIN domain-containing protein [Asticcacaulis sp. AC402]|uniref:GIN domain-containing protein n=1 Tax=Asticcacaulis sp. AC402 TaxID=1282361 RepID=UPI0003C3C8FD|nr:DUF2807 domain-containing protein [Asticcacaulis sp. AC402]ESQ73846.1 hemagglutinin [Asticcacaulis sp. AC402]